MSKMQRMLRLFVPSIMVLALFAGTAIAENVVVDGVDQTFGASDEIDNLTVKNGGRAFVTGSTISGNVTIEGSGSYAKLSFVTVAGNVTVKNAGALSVEYTTIGENLHGIKSGQINMWQVTVVENLNMMQCAAFAGYLSEVGGNVSIRKSDWVLLHRFNVDGNVHVVDNVSDYLYVLVHYCEIGGNLKVNDNDMKQYVRVEGTTVGGNLECVGNPPTATLTDNTVAGKVKTD